MGKSGVRRFAVLTAAVVFLAGSALLVGGCSKGGGDDDAYNFNGTWHVTGTLIESNYTNTALNDTAVINQDGGTIVIRFAGMNGLRGICDPDTGTMQINDTASGVTVTINAHSIDEDTMVGEASIVYATNHAKWNITMQLTSRSTTLAVAGPAKTGSLASFAGKER